jgi:hypothetical protein
MPRQFTATGDIDQPAAGSYTHPNHTGDVTSVGDGATAIASGVIVDGDVNGSAAIALSKLGAGGLFEPAGIHLTKPGAPTGQQDCGGAGGTVTVITWGAEIAKSSSYFTHSTSTNPEQVQCDFDGVVEVTFTVGITQGGAARTTHAAQYRVNGGGWIRRGNVRNYTRGSSYGDSSAHLTTEVEVSDGDYLEFAVWIDDTDASYTQNTINDECDLVIRRVS